VSAYTGRDRPKEPTLEPDLHPKAPPVVLFAYDQAQQALIFGLQNGQIAGVHAKVLRGLGWQADDANFRVSLPRFDKPLIQAAPAQAMNNIRKLRS
jgi:hypothetical protein